MEATAVAYMEKLETRTSKQAVTTQMSLAISKLASVCQLPLRTLVPKLFVNLPTTHTQNSLHKAKDKPRCMIFQGNKDHQFCQTRV